MGPLGEHGEREQGDVGMIINERIVARNDYIRVSGFCDDNERPRLVGSGRFSVFLK